MFVRLAALTASDIKTREPDAPSLVFAGPQNVQAFVGSPVSFNVSASISDSSPITLTLDEGPVGAFTDNGDGTGAFLWTPTSEDVGAVDITITAGDTYGRSFPRSAVITVTQPAVGEMLELAAMPVVLPSVDISAGSIDWAHWGLGDASSVNRKVGTSIIGTLSAMSGSALRYTGAAGRQQIAWSGGTPTASEVGTLTGLYSSSGFRLTIPVTESARELHIFSGLFNCAMKVTASISGSALTRELTTAVSATGVDHAFKCNYFGTTGQTLTLDFERVGTTGNVSFRAARLAGSVGASWSTPLEAEAHIPFTSTLTLSGVTGVAVITATNLPGSTSFTDNGDNTATLVWTPTPDDALGSPFVFGITATQGGASILSTQVNVTVAAATASPPVVTVPTLDFAVGVAKSVTVSATGETPVALTVTGLPGSANWIDNGNSTATLSWTPEVGSDATQPYPIVILATDVDGRPTIVEQSISVANTAADLLDVTVLSTVNTGDVDLTVLGTLDWKRWAATTTASVDRKSGATDLIGDLVITGPSGVTTRTWMSGRTVSFSDGAPTPTSTAPHHLLLASNSTEIATLVIPAAPTTRTLYLAYGATNGSARLTISITGGDPVVEISANSTGQHAWLVAVEFRANDKDLTVAYKRESGGAVWVQGAAIKEGGL